MQFHNCWTIRIITVWLDCDWRSNLVPNRPIVSLNMTFTVSLDVILKCSLFHLMPNLIFLLRINVQEQYCRFWQEWARGTEAYHKLPLLKNSESCRLFWWILVSVASYSGFHKFRKFFDVIKYIILLKILANFNTANFT